jgi:hypothetical protein
LSYPLDGLFQLSRNTQPQENLKAKAKAMKIGLKKTRPKDSASQSPLLGSKGI